MVLQKLFSAFPHGSPGVGLLLLRVLVSVTVFAQTIGYVAATQLRVADWVLVALLVASAACLVVGLLTPVAAVLIGLTSLVVGFSTAADSIQHVDIAVLAIVIALLGPGAFSIDARMFGRRQILIPGTRPSKL